MRRLGHLFDTRTNEMLLSAAIVIAVLGVLLIGASAFGLASDRLLKFGCVNVVAGVGLGLFSGTTGILSLGHVLFFGVGAYVASWFTLPTSLKPMLLPAMPEFIVNAQYGLWFALVPAILATVAIGAVTGPVVARLRDTSAVIASFGILVIGYLLMIGLKPLTNGKQSLYGIPTSELGWPLLFVTMSAAILAAFLYKSGSLARATEAARDDELAARAIGIRPNRGIFWSWVISAGVMGLAGALYAHAIGVIAPDSFYLEKSFALIVIIILGGYRSITGCVTGAVIVTVLEEVLRNTETWLADQRGQQVLGLFEMPQIFGFTALCFSLIILLVFYLRPDGVVGYREAAAFAPISRRVRGRTRSPGTNAEPQAFTVSPEARLETRDLQKSYGPFKAMDEVNLTVGAGEIVGLIGPNGAGKSTFINTITGALFATGGSIWIDGEDATLWPASRIARQGLGRTFQNIRIFTSLSVLENVIAAVNVNRPDLSRAAAEQRAIGWIAYLDLTEFTYDLASGLSYGDQRRLEIARAIALEPKFLLLDEPAAGMNHTETRDLQALLQEVTRRIGCGLILVEHDLPMVMSLCDRIYVLNKGELIASGTPKVVREDPNVIEAYIGNEDH